MFLFSLQESLSLAQTNQHEKMKWKAVKVENVNNTTNLKRDNNAKK